MRDTNLYHNNDIWKVGHHGSKYSTGEELLDRISPSYAFISSGTNNIYGHPHRDVLTRLDRHGSKVFQTREKGAICLDCDGRRCKVYYWTDR